MLDKPEGPTSHDVVDMVRRALRVRRVGHAGTLDPSASGLLLVLVGRATRLSRFLVGLPKSYTGGITLGIETDTDDHTGAVLREDESWRSVSDEAVATAMQQLTGRLEQLPPVYSAKHSGGQRAHRLARRGQPVELTPQDIEVTRFELAAREGSRVTFAADVGSGTYVRALARDLGRALGCGAHLHELRRTAVGPFRVEDAARLETLEGEAPALRPPLEAVPHLPSCELDEEQRVRAAHGQPLEGFDQPGDYVALVADGELVAVAEPCGDVLKPRVVLEG